jgi:hypothetical protein
VVFLHSGLPDEKGVVSERPAFSFLLLPGMPAQRLSVMQGALAVEYTIGMSAQRWRDLTTELSPGARHAVSVELPDDPASRAVIEIDPSNLPVRAAAGPYELEVQQVLAEPPFPIITEGYRDSTSSLAVVRVTKPSDPAFKPFTRYVYHRFPEINQDMLDELNERGMPKRTDPDPSIRLGYIDASMIQVYFDDAVTADGNAGTTRAVVRSGRGPVRVIDPLNAGDSFEFVDKVSLRVGPAWEHAEPVGRPRPVPEMEQDRSLVGTHGQSLLAVEVSSTAVKDASGRPWKTVTWLPFTKYMGQGLSDLREVGLPGGRRVRVGFGRLQHVFPNFAIQLVDFQMLAYDHRGSPRDYQSIIRVTPTNNSFEAVRARDQAQRALDRAVPLERRPPLGFQLRPASCLGPFAAPIQAEPGRLGPLGLGRDPADGRPGDHPAAVREVHDPGRWQQPGHPRHRAGRGAHGHRHPVGVLHQALAREARVGPHPRGGRGGNMEEARSARRPRANQRRRHGVRFGRCKHTRSRARHGGLRPVQRRGR